MANPILNAMSQMQKINDVMKMVGNLNKGNAQAIYDQMIQSNPEFKNFIEKNKGKTPEQIAKDNGIDLSMIMQFIR